MASFFCFYPLQFRLNKDFCGLISGEGLVVFRPFSKGIIFEIFVLCQECAKSCIGLRKTIIFFLKILRKWKVFFQIIVISRFDR